MERSLRGAFGITLGALLVRTAYAFSQPVLQGDAVHYVEVAQQVSRGGWAEVDAWWFTPFSLLLAGLHAVVPLPWVGLSRAATVAAGAATVLVIALAGRKPFGQTAALVAASVVALHPRMIEASAEAYTEPLYILLLVGFGLAALHGHLPEAPGTRERVRVLPAILGGLLLGALFTLRPESALLALLGLGVLHLFEARSGEGIRSPALAREAMAVLVAALVIAAYAASFGPRVEGPVLFGKRSTLQTTEPLSPQNAQAVARESYGPGGIAFDPPALAPGELATRVVRGYPRKAALAPRAAVSALVHPLLPALAGAGVWLCRRRRRNAVAFAATLALVPFAAYPLAHIIARYVYQVVPWVALLAGLAVSRAFARWPGHAARAALLAALLLPLLAATVVLGARRSSRGMEYRELAGWMDGRLGSRLAPESLPVVTQAPELGLYSRVASRRILPWLEHGCALRAWMQDQQLRLAALDRAYVAISMPQYLPLLESPDPAGFAVVREVRSRGNLVRLLRRDDGGCP